MNFVKDDEKKRIKDGIISIFKGKNTNNKEMKIIQLSESVKSSNSNSPNSDYIKNNLVKDNKAINDNSINEQNTVSDSFANEKHVEIKLIPKENFKNFNKENVFDEKFNESFGDEAL